MNDSANAFWIGLPGAMQCQPYPHLSRPTGSRLLLQWTAINGIEWPYRAPGSHHFNCAFEEDFTLIVEAPDEKAAELMAAKVFMLNEWQRKRLLVRKHP
jgi:hypothetical protein